ncbi:MAG TPA: sarcosine oxidase subunit gamma family protein [Xanthobacteraceae bacterium]|nr:sarcosine oxidase subunit gamma family protein [Xanthobacteraceae bacterium]
MSEPGDGASPATARLALLEGRAICLVLAAAAARDEIGMRLTTLAGQHGFSARWAGVDRWFVVATGEPGRLAATLQEALAGHASILDQSDGQVAIGIAGDSARATLAKGIALDLHPENFKPGDAAATRLGHVAIQLARTGADAFEILVPRSYAMSVWESLAEMAAEFGCEVQPIAID